MSKAKVATTVEVDQQTKFLSVLGKNLKEIKGQRAVIISEDAQAASEKLINDLKTNLRRLKSALLTLEDINANGAFVSNPVKENFDATSWIKDMHNIKLQIIDMEIELQVAVETHNTWFSTTAEE